MLYVNRALDIFEVNIEYDVGDTGSRSSPIVYIDITKLIKVGSVTFTERYWDTG